MNCIVCGKKAESKFCELHEQAYKNLLRNYKAWKSSMRVSWAEYLTKIQNNEFTGLWVKEVARYLLASDHPEKPNDKAER
jgi:hypothetical protein